MNESPLLIGEKVRLTAVEKADMPMVRGWYQDTIFLRNYGSNPAYPLTLAELEKRLDQMQTDKNTYSFAIRPVLDDRLIGLIEIEGIYWSQRTGWLGIAIGEESMRGQGYGIEAMCLILDFGFRELNLHRIQLSVFAYNLPAIALYDKVGFTREGAHRAYLHRDGERHDMIVFGILRHEWEARV